MEIQPFGGVTWADSLSAIVARLNQQGAKKIELKLGRVEIQLAGLTEVPTVDAALATFLTSAYQTDRPNFKELRHPERPAFYWNNKTMLKVEPFNLFGGFYRMEMELESIPGLMFARPNNLVWVEGTPRLVSVFALWRTSLDPVVASQEQKTKVRETVMTKYGFAEHATTVRHGNVMVTCNNFIEYKQTREALEELKAPYEEMLMRVATAGKRDQTDQL